MTTNDLIISFANSIRFVNQTTGLQTFDNTLFADETHNFVVSKCFNQEFLTGETILIQVKCGLTAAPVLERYFTTGIIATISETEITTYSDYKIYDYLITFSGASTSYFYIYNSDASIIWQSEPVEVVTELTDYLKLEWFNFDSSQTANNNYNFDYSTGSARDYVNYLYISGSLLEYKPAGKATIYDNQDEKVKVKENLYRKLTLKTGSIPRYLAEKLIIAQSHDIFTVNGVQYVCEELPNVEQFGRSNMVSVTMELTQQSILGFNTDDLGFDPDNVTSNSMIENKVIQGATSNGSFAISAGFSIQQVIAKKNSGSDVMLKIGTTVGGDEIYPETEIGTDLRIDNLVDTKNFDTAWTLYYTITGTSPNIDLAIMTINHMD